MKAVVLAINWAELLLSCVATFFVTYFLLTSSLDSDELAAMVAILCILASLGAAAYLAIRMVNNDGTYKAPVIANILLMTVLSLLLAIGRGSGSPDTLPLLLLIGALFANTGLLVLYTKRGRARGSSREAN